jgi:hypothetical protein
MPPNNTSAANNGVNENEPPMREKRKKLNSAESPPAINPFSQPRLSRTLNMQPNNIPHALITRLTGDIASLGKDATFTIKANNNTAAMQNNNAMPVALPISPPARLTSSLTLNKKNTSAKVFHFILCVGVFDYSFFARFCSVRSVFGLRKELELADPITSALRFFPLFLQFFR